MLGALDLQGLRKCGKQDLNRGGIVNPNKPCTILYNPATITDNFVQSHVTLTNAGGGTGGGTKQSEL